jgi:hypothetical protein
MDRFDKCTRFQLSGGMYQAYALVCIDSTYPRFNAGLDVARITINMTIDRPTPNCERGQCTRVSHQGNVITIALKNSSKIVAGISVFSVSIRRNWKGF